MWCVIEYISQGAPACWAIPKTWLDEETNTIFYPPKWNQMAKIISNPDPTWSKFIYRKIIFDNICKYILTSFPNIIIYSSNLNIHILLNRHLCRSSA